MKEALLQYIWKFQLYHLANLKTVTQDDLQIIYQGDYNTTQHGPDFLNASIVINGIKLFGNIEIHVFASDWIKHQHTNDSNYQSVILHVVYFNDVELINGMPTLQLNGRVMPLLLQKYRTIMDNNNVVKCKNLSATLNSIVIQQAKEKAIIHRLERKSVQIQQQLHQFNGDWNQVHYYNLVQCFFDKSNQFAAKNLLVNLPYSVLLKHADNIFQLEALLFGVAGLLHDNFSDDYPSMLQKEFSFLQAKYQLKISNKKYWNYFRIRPMSFPSIRLSQLANLLHTSPQFVRLYQLDKVKYTLQNVQASVYWQTHYLLDKSTSNHTNCLGKKQIDKILINYTLPIQYTYAKYEQKPLEYILEYYYSLSKETNNKTKLFDYEHFNHKTAYDSQAFIELHDEFCTKQKCLQCVIGHHVLAQSNKIQNYIEEENVFYV
ncbi:MAG: DUF2851 family protein [Chitinophagales bacterium]|nr:DUF2851 family protein [Chitinophagales bacterium]